MRDLTYRLVIGVFRLLYAALDLRVTVRGAHHIPRHGAAVLACNHTGFLDFSLAALPAVEQGRLVRFMAKQSSFDHPVSGPLMRRMRHIAVDRRFGAPAYRAGLRAVAAGELVGVFPEATISRAWTLKPFKAGAAALAIAESVPLVPVVVWGAHRLFTVDSRRSLRRGMAVTVLVGEPLHPEPGADREAVSAELRGRMAQLLDEAQRGYPDRPRSAEDSWWQPAHLGGSAPTPERAAALDEAGVARSELRRAR
jgi:1-acyl-sn-glycerol-3-phosphate acyltransferase